MDSGRYADGNCGGFAQTVPRSVLYASPLTSLDVYVPEKTHWRMESPIGPGLLQYQLAYRDVRKWQNLDCKKDKMLKRGMMVLFEICGQNASLEQLRYLFLC